jgi:hypothetical protein
MNPSELTIEQLVEAAQRIRSLDESWTRAHSRQLLHPVIEKLIARLVAADERLRRGGPD